MRISEIMLPEFDREMSRTRKVLAGLSAEHMQWQAYDSLHTIGWNANHLVDIVSWTPLIIAHDEFDMVPVDGPKHETPSIADPKLLLAGFDRNVVDARKALHGATDQALAEAWSLKMGGQTLFKIPKAECLRTWVFNHVVHHRAILSIYLRMFGTELTPVYDE